MGFHKESKIDTKEPKVKHQTGNQDHGDHQSHNQANAQLAPPRPPRAALRRGRRTRGRAPRGSRRRAGRRSLGGDEGVETLTGDVGIHVGEQGGEIGILQGGSDVALDLREGVVRLEGDDLEGGGDVDGGVHELEGLVGGVGVGAAEELLGAVGRGWVVAAGDGRLDDVAGGVVHGQEQAGLNIVDHDGGEQ